MIDRASIQVVLMQGGASREREVSLQSGKAVGEALNRLGYKVEILDPVPGEWTLPTGTDVVFLALHGTYGEDGQIQSELEELGVSFTGSDARASRLAFDKLATKRLLQESGLRTPDYLVLEDVPTHMPEGWSCPNVLKPRSEGSSVGLYMPQNEAQWRLNLEEALTFGKDVIMEKWIRGREITVGILNGDVLPVVEVKPLQGVYDYHHKYTPGATTYICPAVFESEVMTQITETAMRAFQTLQCRDYARVDMMVDGHGTGWVLEINTLPGMTQTSLLPMAARQAGIEFDALCDQMTQCALRRRGDL